MSDNVTVGNAENNFQEQCFHNTGEGLLCVRWCFVFWEPHRKRKWKIHDNGGYQLQQDYDCKIQYTF